MLCPFPTKCMYDRYKIAGVHFCAIPSCPYHEVAELMLREEIEALERMRRRTPRQEMMLAQLRMKYKENFT